MTLYFEVLTTLRYNLLIKKGDYVVTRENIACGKPNDKERHKSLRKMARRYGELSEVHESYKMGIEDCCEGKLRCSFRETRVMCGTQDNEVSECRYKSSNSASK